MGASEFEDHSWEAFCEATASRGRLSTSTPQRNTSAAMSVQVGLRSTSVPAEGPMRATFCPGDGGCLPSMPSLRGEDSSRSGHRGAHETARNRDGFIPHGCPPPSRPRYAQFSLPFAGDDFDAGVANVLASVVPGGAFVGSSSVRTTTGHQIHMSRRWLANGSSRRSQISASSRSTSVITTVRTGPTVPSSTGTSSISGPGARECRQRGGRAQRSLRGERQQQPGHACVQFLRPIFRGCG